MIPNYTILVLNISNIFIIEIMNLLQQGKVSAVEEAMKLSERIFPNIWTERQGILFPAPPSPAPAPPPPPPPLPFPLPNDHLYQFRYALSVRMSEVYRVHQRKKSQKCIAVCTSCFSSFSQNQSTLFGNHDCMYPLLLLPFYFSYLSHFYFFTSHFLFWFFF